MRERVTIYSLMDAEIIDKPMEWAKWDTQQRNDWAFTVKQEWQLDVRLLEERFLLTDSREQKD